MCQGYDFSESRKSLSTQTHIFTNVSGKKKSVTLGNPQATDADGLLIDVDVQPVSNNPSAREDK